MTVHAGFIHHNGHGSTLEVDPWNPEITGLIGEGVVHWGMVSFVSVGSLYVYVLSLGD